MCIFPNLSVPSSVHPSYNEVFLDDHNTHAVRFGLEYNMTAPCECGKEPV